MKKFFSITFFLLFIVNCGEPKLKPQIKIFEENEKIPTQESWDTEIYITEKGVLKAILYSDNIKVYEDDKTKFLEGVNIHFFDEAGVQTSSLKAKRGKIDDKTENMFAYDSVVAVSDSGVTLYTDELIWNNKNNQIESDKFVKIISDVEQIEGYGFKSDQSLRNYVIYNISYITNLNENNN